MRHRWWIAALCLACALAGDLPARSLGLKDLLHRKEKAKKDQTQFVSCIKRRAWMGYFQNDAGEYSPLRDTLNTENDEDWIGLKFTDYDGPRIRLGVLKVINKSAESEERGDADRIEVPVAGIQETLTAALYATKRFDVIEQKRTEEIKAQQTRKDILDPSPSTIINLGKVLGAQYLVYGTVNEWNPNRANRSMGPGGVFAAGKKEAEIAITFTLTDVANGQILFTTPERARMGEWNFGFGAPGGGGGGSAQNTPVNYLVRACANKAALKIAMYLRDRKWKGSVVDIQKGGEIYINAGSQQGMAPQTKLAVLSVKGVITDPENHTVLGENLRGIGTLEVVAVQNAFSIAQVVDGCQGIKKGDRVELATSPAPPQAIPECDALDATTAP